MNRVRSAILNAQNAFYDFIFPRGLVWYKAPKKRIKVFRYPSPASEPIDHDFNKMDYKVAYRDSTYNVRYANYTKENLEINALIQDPIGDTVEKKLIRYGYLNIEQQNDKKAIENASKQYEAEVGEPVAQTVYMDDFRITERPIDRNNRDSVAQYVRQMFTSNREVNEQEAYLDNLKDIYNPQILQYNTWDMAADDPVWRQLKLDIEYNIETNINMKDDLGYIPVFKGDPNFWQILDNSFSSDQIRLVQSSVRDTLTNIDTEVLESQHDLDKLHKYDRLVLPIKNNVL